MTRTTALEKGFEQLKLENCCKPILACPHEAMVFMLHTDASERGLGAVLSQEDAEGQEKLIVFYSRKLLSREGNYSTIEKECLHWESGCSEAF